MMIMESRRGGTCSCVHKVALRFMLLLLPFFFTNGRAQSQHSTARDEIVAGLLAFKSQIRDPFAHLSSWNNNSQSSLPCSSWAFIRCNNLRRRVSDISLNELSLSGDISSAVQLLNLNLRHLNHLSLSRNRFTGELNFLVNLTRLRTLDLSYNELQGPIGYGISALHFLKEIRLQGNQFSGAVPADLGLCPHLKVINLGENQFHGIIPNSIRRLQSLEVLNLSNNKLTGGFPVWISDLTLLTQLDMSSNGLTGSITGEIGASRMLRYFNLSRNDMTSRLPAKIGSLRKLRALDLRNSGVYGSVPRDICGNSSSLSILQLDENSLTGAIPDEICNCSSLYLLSLSRNSLNGSIPKTISKLRKLRILRLEFNKFSGVIPEDLGNLSDLLAINVSYNNLVGKLPSNGIFPNLDASSLQGNPGICSPILKGPCKMNVSKPLVIDPNLLPKDRARTESPSSPLHQHRRRYKFLSVSAITAISAATLVALCVILISFLNASSRRLSFIDRALESIGSGSGSIPTTGRLVLFDSKSSLPQDWISSPGTATILLKKAEEVGRGASGIVYRVPLQEQGDGECVAIKKLNFFIHLQDFDREVRALGKARHFNLVALRGYQWTPESQLLVSDYVSNGSLKSKLEASSLTWAIRFKIIEGVANGLAHLHHSITPPIIHYNVKSSNILLDCHYNPKISDFGLVAKNRSVGASWGYDAPELEYQKWSRVNEKCDVYGFGVIILEIVSGKRAIERSDDEGSVVRLCDHVRVVMEEGGVMECVDLGMGEYPEEEVLPILKLGLVCTSLVPSSRPSMAEVVRILTIIRTPVC